MLVLSFFSVQNGCYIEIQLPYKITAILVPSHSSEGVSRVISDELVWPLEKSPPCVAPLDIKVLGKEGNSKLLSA